MNGLVFHKSAKVSKRLAKIMNFIAEYSGAVDDFKDEFLKEFKIPFLGNGQNAFVFELSKTRALRIEFYSSTMKYFKWMRYCIENQDLKSIPKIFMACTFRNMEKRCNVLLSVVEKLGPLRGSKLFKDMGHFIDTLYIFFRVRTKEEDVLEFMLSCLRKEVKRNGLVVEADEYLKIKSSIKGINDIHEGNLMVSFDQKRLVITDPMG